MDRWTLTITNTTDYWPFQDSRVNARWMVIAGSLVLLMGQEHIRAGSQIMTFVFEFYQDSRLGDFRSMIQKKTTQNKTVMYKYR